MGTSTSTPSRRTTITLTPESQEIVGELMSASGTSASGAINRIIEESRPKPSRLKELNGFLVLDTPANRSGRKLRVTVEDIKRIEDEMDREYVERLWPQSKRRGRKKSSR